MRILGIDPGSVRAGYGVIDARGREITLLEHGTLKLVSRADPDNTKDHPKRLLSLYDGLQAVIARTEPRVIAIEKMFFAKNARSALVLGQARGVALLAAAKASLPIFEYSATEVKQTVTGSGRADKDQVSRMLQILFGNQRFATPDASDALAIALCHALRARFPLTRWARGMENDSL